MCSILGYQGTALTMAQLSEAFSCTRDRGPDSTRGQRFSSRCTLLFHRLAIMGLTESGSSPLSEAKTPWSATASFTVFGK